MVNHLLKLAVHAGLLASIIVFLAVPSTTPVKQSIASLSKETLTAATFFVPSITIAQLQKDYREVNTSRSSSAPQKKIRVLIVPGHQAELGGTEFRDILERDIVVDIANSLGELLSRNPHYEVFVSRGSAAWNPIFQDYFDTFSNEIAAFRDSQMREMSSLVADGSFRIEPNQVMHNSASSEASIQLYGINKWASEHKMDITMHLHLNDHAERRSGEVGKYDGFSIFVPDSQYSNAEASRAIGEAIAVRMNAYHATSTLPKESSGVIDSRELIAIGSNNSIDGAALLMEYGYIYEPQFLDRSVRTLAVNDYAYATYLGLQDFFGDSVNTSTGSTAFPYEWSLVSADKKETGPGIYALQAALRHLGYYPPSGETFSDCPVSGKMGPCTQAGIRALQSAHGLEQTGTLGSQTRVALESELSKP